MKQSINYYDFRKAFEDYSRENHFSPKGLRALFDWLEEYEDSIGEELELDVIAFCIDFTEYDDVEEVKEYYDMIEDIDDLRDHTQVIEFDGGLIIQDF